MERTPRTILISLVGIIFFIFIVLFGYNRFGRYIDGPKITEINLEPHQTIDTLDYAIKGSVENTASIKINNNEIILNQDQSFEHIIVFSPGHTIIEIEVIDPFDKVRRYSYSLSTTQESKQYFPTYQQAQEQRREATEELLSEEDTKPIN